MLVLKGKLKRLNAGMPSHEFWEMVEKRRSERGWHSANSQSAVRSFVASVFRVKPEHEAEIAACIQMLCESTAIIPVNLGMALDVFSMKALRLYVYGNHPLAVETDRGWLVYPLNIRHVNRQLSHRRKP
jgi:hypothetical protein